MALYNRDQIMDILPHRDPFLMLDTIEELEPGVRAVGKKFVRLEEPHFAGHFPGNPVMPGILIIEAMAQTGAVAMLSLPKWRGKTAYFAGIDKAKFKGKVVPGEELVLETKITRVIGTIGKGEASAYVNGHVVARAELTFAIGD